MRFIILIRFNGIDKYYDGPRAKMNERNVLKNIRFWLGIYPFQRNRVLS